VNAWERQRALARTTNGWAVASIAVGAVLAARSKPWRRAFGLQHLGWGVVDLGIVAVLNGLQTRRMRRLDHPQAPTALAGEQRRLHRVLLITVAADAGYLIGGLVMWRQRETRVSGAGAAIAIQGAFLLAHDAYHAAGSAP
jgi:hypothetical protein